MATIYHPHVPVYVEPSKPFKSVNALKCSDLFIVDYVKKYIQNQQALDRLNHIDHNGLYSWVAGVTNIQVLQSRGSTDAPAGIALIDCRDPKSRKTHLGTGSRCTC